MKNVRGLYRRGNIWWLRYVGLDGKIIFESSGTNKLRDAEDLLHKRKADVKDGKQPETKTITNCTFHELSEEYIKWSERQRCFKSKRGFVQQLDKHFGSVRLNRIKTLMVEQYQTMRTKKGNKAATINRHIATIKHMITKAVDWNMVGEETLKQIRKVKMLEENNRRLRYLSKEECVNLINACADHLKRIVIMALHTGMRKSEILFLKWDSIDLHNGFILLDITKNGDRREIPIDDTLRNTLNNIIRRVDVPYVFYDQKTGSCYQDIKTAFNNACRRAGIRDFRFHDLRHTFASHLVMAGQDLTTIKELLGHKTLTMTLRYAHLAPSHKVKAVALLDSILTENSTIQKVYKKEGAANS